MSKELFNNEQLQDVVKSSFENIKEKISKELITEISDSLKWRLRDEYEQIIKDFIIKEIKPDLQNMLIKNKSIMLNEITNQIGDVGQLMGAKIKEKFIEDLAGSGYKSKKVIDALF